jgi:hypothetical protein
MNAVEKNTKGQLAKTDQLIAAVRDVTSKVGGALGVMPI